ncbi:hypothetical protein B8V81_2334 [Paenibacillus pasadenensis]|uniref:Uncharacterized protein n=1 Tax=Paenibacillus pasadenensis TaxID=217090 RepID=A0A2N5N0P3_9BACL|nr:hypothetical protein B8V81_2334 [Paenibacillus pasadenensis]
MTPINKSKITDCIYLFKKLINKLFGFGVLPNNDICLGNFFW